MSQPLRSWTSVHVVAPDAGRLLLAPLAVALPSRWWHTPGHWSYDGCVIPATEFTVTPEDLPEMLGILLPYAVLMASALTPTLLSDSLDASAYSGWADLLILGSDRLAHASWDVPDALLLAEVAAIWDGLGGSSARRTRGITHQLRWLGATVAAPTDGAVAPSVFGTVDSTAWTSPEELPLGLVARLAHLQAARVCAGTGLAAEVEVRVLRFLLTSGEPRPEGRATA